MRLALSSAAAPTLSAPELFAACARRGIGAVELVQGHGHGIGLGSSDTDVRRVLTAAEAAGVRIVAFRTTGDAAAASVEAARLSRRLGAPIVSPPGSGERAGAALAGVVARYGAEGGSILVAHTGDPGDVRALREIAGSGGAHVALAWDVAPTRPDGGSGAPAPGGPADAAAVLALCGGRLRHIRLLGGGPEAAAQEGLGIGELAVHLALGGYPGALALAPSTPRYLTAWGFWLGRRGWGCGSTEEPGRPLRLGGAA